MQQICLQPSEPAVKKKFTAVLFIKTIPQAGKEKFCFIPEFLPPNSPPLQNVSDNTPGALQLQNKVIG